MLSEVHIHIIHTFLLCKAVFIISRLESCFLNAFLLYYCAKFKNRNRFVQEFWMDLIFGQKEAVYFEIIKVNGFLQRMMLKMPSTGFEPVTERL